MQGPHRCRFAAGVIAGVAAVGASIGLLAGTDAMRPLYRWTSAAAIVTVVFATAYRLLSGGRRGRAERPERARATDPGGVLAAGPP